MITAVSRRRTNRALGYTVGLAALWFVVAAWRPEVTYHLAPLLIAATPPVIMSLDTTGSGPAHATRPGLVGAGVAGLAVGIIATAVLSALGWLAGPSLLPVGGAATEAVAFAAIGAPVGLALALHRFTST